MNHPTPKPQPRMLQLVDAESHYIDETALAIGMAVRRGKHLWAVYLVEPTSFKRIAYRIINLDTEPELIPAILMDLIEEGVEALPGSRFLAMRQHASDAIHKLTGLRLELMEHSMHIEYDFQLLCEEAIPSTTIRTKKKKQPDDFVLATDASRRAIGACAYGWVMIRPGTKIEPRTFSVKPPASRVSRLETLAILDALKSVTLPRNGAIHILSDSTAALKNISEMFSDTSRTHPLWLQMDRKRMDQMLNLMPAIKLYWVKAHNGNPANDAVDTLVRGSTLATTHQGVDRLALEGLKRIIERRREELKQYTLEELLAGAVPYYSVMDDSEAIAA